MVNVGDVAPDFSLPSSCGDIVSLRDYLGKPCVLYFYPKDDTPGCSKQACDFRDDFEAYTSKNIIILGISRDGIEAHKHFIEKYNLPFLLLSDESGEVCNSYGVWKEKTNFGKKYMGIERTTFLINTKGIIQKILKRVQVEGHSEKVLQCFESV